MRRTAIPMLGAFALCASVSCSGEGGDNEGGRTVLGPVIADTDGTAGTAAPTDGPLFDNTDAVGKAPEPPPPSSEPDAGQQAPTGPCEVGQFCAPTSPDPDKCGTIMFEPDVEVIRTPGNLIVVFDQSISMEDEWAGTANSKLGAARGALEAALTPLQDEVTVAAVFLPTATCFDPFYDPYLTEEENEAWGILKPPAMDGDAVPPIDDPSQVNFMPGPEFLQAWNAQWNSFVGGQLIGTPLQEGFDRADEAIRAARENGLLAGEGALAVVAFTDGEPNCVPNPDVTGRSTMGLAERAAQWLTEEVKTYVVGLPGADQGAATLNGVAQAGGTDQYIDPADPAALEEKLRQVVSETVETGFNSCSINLDPIPEVPEELQMIVEEEGMRSTVARDFGSGGGWALDDNGHVEIMGQLCDDALTGRFASITFEYACPDVPPPPPLPVPE